MKLISCENCGVVVDTDRIPIDEDSLLNDDGTYNSNLTQWYNIHLGFMPIIACPTCKKRIFHHNGELA